MRLIYFEELLNWFWWLASPLYWWVVTRLDTENVKDELKLDPRLPVVYVLPRRSFIDLLVLDRMCKRSGLPRPRGRLKHLTKPGRAAVIFLSKQSLIILSRINGAPSPIFTTSLL